MAGMIDPTLAGMQAGPHHHGTVHHGTVLPEWIDNNGHMNVACYLMAFDRALDDFTDAIGFTRAYRAAHQSGIFVVEAHLTYGQELLEGEAYRIETRVLGIDGKKLHLFERMERASDGAQAATCEMMILHMDMQSRRSAPFPAPILAGLIELEQKAAERPLPPEAGRSVGIGQRRPS